LFLGCVFARADRFDFAVVRPAAAGGRTQSGTFRDGDLLVNKDGLRIVSHSEEGEVN
jgi:hypothetical protein